MILLSMVAGVAAADGPVRRPLVGAIRWDAWHAGTKGPVRAMEASLGPKRYHWRLPFFAKVVSDSEVRIGGYTQEMMDREIAFARAGGLDYWAFLLYDPKSPMSQGLSFYLDSSHKRDIGFCAIAAARSFGDAQQFRHRTRRLIGLMGEPNYVRVAGDRPLLYVFRVSDESIQAWGGEKNARALFDRFRADVREAGHGDPYIVCMESRLECSTKVSGIIGGQAISCYAVGGHLGGNGTPYRVLAGAARERWEASVKKGAQVVPTVMAGWDRRPRVEHPVPWEKSQRPGVGLNRFFVSPTPEELAAHVRDALDWTVVRPDACPAQAVIVYAWNEHDEGGWLCPTRGPDGRPDTSRLDALARMLKGYGKK